MCNIQLERKDDLEKQVIFSLTQAQDQVTLTYPAKTTSALEHHA